MLEPKESDLSALHYMHRTPHFYAVRNLNEDALELLGKRKYPKGALTSSASYNYLGSGHVKKWKAAPIPSKRVLTVLKRLGI